MPPAAAAPALLHVTTKYTLTPLHVDSHGRFEQTFSILCLPKVFACVINHLLFGSQTVTGHYYDGCSAPFVTLSRCPINKSFAFTPAGPSSKILFVGKSIRKSSHFFATCFSHDYFDDFKKWLEKIDDDLLNPFLLD